MGDKIKNETMDLMSDIFRANSSTKKRLYYLDKSKQRVEMLKLYIRLSKDLKILPMNKYIDIAQILESISKQIYAWHKSVAA